MPKIRLKNSVVANRQPSASALDIGELAVNASNASPALYFRDDSNVVHKIAPGASADSGGTGDRPGTNNNVGDLFYDTDLGVLLVWNGSSWEPIDTGVATVDLGYTPAQDKGTVTNTAGTPAEIPLVGTDAGLMAPGDKTKLDGVTAGAEPNVKPDWNAAGGSDAEILNKPDIPEKTSDLVNDGDGTSNFVTLDDISGLGGGSVTSVDSGDGLTGGPITASGTLSVVADGDTIAVSASGIKVADGKFAEPGDLPTNTSELTNDGEDGVNAFITANELPTKTSELTNDGENGADPFITANDLPAPPDLSGYLELEGGNMTGAVTQTERFVTSAAGGFDLSESNFWACSLADVPTPTNGVNGQSGLIRFENVVNSWDAAFKNTPTSVEPGDIIPFYVEGPASIALGTKNVTGSVAGFWVRDGGTSTLSPANTGDIVQTGGDPQSAVVGARMRGDIGTLFTCVPSGGVAFGIYEEGKTQRNCSINSNGSATFGSLVEVNTEGYRADDENVFAGKNAAGTVTSAIRADGKAEFAGTVVIGAARGVDAPGASFESFGQIRASRASTQVDPGNASVWQGFLGTNATSEIFADGTANFTNIRAALTQEQQAAYGIQELDIKERILNFITRIEQLEARVAELEGN